MKIPGLSFSLKRAVGISAAKQKIARKTGIPLTKGGLERKMGKMVINSITGKKKKLFLLAALLIASLDGVAEKRQFLNLNYMISKEWMDYAIDDLEYPELHSPKAIYGKSRLLLSLPLNYNFNYCVISNPEDLRFFAGIADFTNKQTPALCWGKLYYVGDNEVKEMDVRFDLDCDLITRKTPSVPKGTFYFDEEYLPLRTNEEVLGADDPDYWHQNTSTGKVAYSKGGFEAKPFQMKDYLQFITPTSGKAIQKGHASGVEWYIGSYVHRGPRRGKRHDRNDGGNYVEYSVNVVRTQPMQVSFNPSTRAFSLTYGTPATATLNYEYADAHPVMTEIKSAYSRWTKVAPPRFKGTDKFLLAGSLPNWLVIQVPDSDPRNPYAFSLFPKEGYTQKAKDPEAPWEQIDVQVGPKFLYDLFLRPLSYYFDVAL